MTKESKGERSAEAEGVVDQQGAAMEKMDEDEAAAGRQGAGSAAERAGVVDQQGAIAEGLDDEE